MRALHLCLDGKWNVNRHLVTVEVRVVSSTNERVNANRRSLNENRLECLNRKTVKGRRTVEQNRVALRHLLKNIPDFGGLALDQLSSRSERCGT